jgi:glutamyl-tRNA synthetase
MMPQVEANPVGRLAPSPTGGLHLGHARTFLCAWLSIRQAGGRMILRIEDLDASRVRPGAADTALTDLRWLGLDWDFGPDRQGPHAPYIQSQRTALYQDLLERFQAADLVYPCTCTRSDIARAASAPHADDASPAYPGTCSHRHAADARSLAGQPFAWRFRVPQGTIRWHDLFQGPIEHDPGLSSGDFIVARDQVGYAYQLAVALDDHLMGVTQVVRGADLVPSTPLQILLHQQLGGPVPTFAHLPLVLGPDGRRLAKRNQSIKLESLRQAGANPRRLIGLLAQSCGWSAGIIPSWPADWIDRFDWTAIPREPWTLTQDLLHTV